MSVEHSLRGLSLLQIAFQLGLCEYGLLNVFQIKVPKFTVFQVNVPLFKVISLCIGNTLHIYYYLTNNIDN